MSAALREAFIAACVLDVEVRKPGNVSVVSPGHRMDAAMFLASAHAAVGPLTEPGAPVGRRILGAVAATQAAVQCNTNLGIVLLAAPVLHAAERIGAGAPAVALRSAIGQTLAALDVADARAAFEAIARANPGGLGRTHAQDVGSPPSIGLREAMVLAAERDRIAAQYANGYRDLFELALPAFRAHPAAPARRLQCSFVELLAAFPDSHIVRKLGAAVAHCVMQEARPWRERAQAGDVLDTDARFAAWDQDLKHRGINPGTTADLCVATALIDALTLS